MKIPQVWRDRSRGIIVGLVGAGSVLFWAGIYGLLSRPLPPSPPFPSVVAERQVEWVPDDQVRAIGRAMEPEKVECIRLCGQQITDKKLIGKFCDGLTHALRLRVPAPGPTGPDGRPFPVNGILAPDYLRIDIRAVSGVPAHELKILYYPDLYEGRFPYSEMPGGTISPEFQDAMRAAGIPRGGPGLPLWQRILNRITGH